MENVIKCNEKFGSRMKESHEALRKVSMMCNDALYVRYRGMDQNHGGRLAESWKSNTQKQQFVNFWDSEKQKRAR